MNMKTKAALKISAELKTVNEHISIIRKLFPNHDLQVVSNYASFVNSTQAMDTKISSIKNELKLSESVSARIVEEFKIVNEHNDIIRKLKDEYDLPNFMYRLTSLLALSEEIITQNDKQLACDETCEFIGKIFENDIDMAISFLYEPNILISKEKSYNMVYKALYKKALDVISTSQKDIIKLFANVDKIAMTEHLYSERSVVNIVASDYDVATFLIKAKKAYLNTWKKKYRNNARILTNILLVYIEILSNNEINEMICMLLRTGKAQLSMIDKLRHYTVFDETTDALYQSQLTLQEIRE